MARMRKNINKNKNNSTEYVENKSNNFKVTAIMCIVMILVAYGFSMLMYSLTKTPTDISEVKEYNIKAEQTFDMPENEYYVLFYDKTGLDALTLNLLVDKYRSQNKKSLYVVDLSKSYNKSVVGVIPNASATDTSSLSIANSTLIKISNKENSGYYESVLLIEKELQ